MGLSVPEPSNPAVSLAHIKAAVEIHTSNTDHDAELTRLELRATEILERKCLRNFTNRTLVLTLDSFPRDEVLCLPRPPLVSVTSVGYIDSNGDSQTWSSSLYHVGAASEPGKITPISSETWPTTDDRIEAVTITYVAGFGADESTVPNGIQQAIILCVKHWFEETTPEGQIPAGAMSLIDGYSHGKFRQVFEV